MISIYHYADGQSLSWAEYGNKQGAPILVEHGLIASIADGHLFDSLVTLGKRVICLARPGYGQSSPYRLRNIAEWGEIASGLIEQLLLEQFDILAFSSGATYGYALAQHYPQRVRRLFILNGIPALYDRQILALWPYPTNQDASLSELQQLAYNLFFTNLPQEALAQNDIKDSLRNNCFGLAQDFLLRVRDWGFQLKDVTVPVHMRHNRSENLLLAQMTANLLPACTLEISDQEEHFSKAVLDDFIHTVMARYLAN